MRFLWLLVLSQALVAVCAPQSYYNDPYKGGWGIDAEATEWEDQLIYGGIVLGGGFTLGLFTYFVTAPFGKWIKVPSAKVNWKLVRKALRNPKAFMQERRRVASHERGKQRFAQQKSGNVAAKAPEQKRVRWQKDMSGPNVRNELDPEDLADVQMCSDNMWDQFMTFKKDGQTAGVPWFFFEEDPYTTMFEMWEHCTRRKLVEKMGATKNPKLAQDILERDYLGEPRPNPQPGDGKVQPIPKTAGTGSKTTQREGATAGSGVSKFDAGKFLSEGWQNMQRNIPAAIKQSAQDFNHYILGGDRPGVVPPPSQPAPGMRFKPKGAGP